MLALFGGRWRWGRRLRTTVAETLALPLFRPASLPRLLPRMPAPRYQSSPATAQPARPVSVSPGVETAAGPAWP